MGAQGIVGQKVRLRITIIAVIRIVFFVVVNLGANGFASADAVAVSGQPVLPVPTRNLVKYRKDIRLALVSSLCHILKSIGLTALLRILML